MHVRLKISHTNHSGSVTDDLQARFGPGNEEALSNSKVFTSGSRDIATANLAYATVKDTYRLIVLRGSNADLDVIMEETPHARLTSEAPRVWHEIHEGLCSLGPKLSSASINADDRDLTLLEGRIGLRGNLLVESVLLPGVLLILLGAIVLAASHTFAQSSWPTMLGGMAATAANFLYFAIRGTWSAYRKPIHWKVSRDVNA
jgi:hypothetical protein